MAPNAAMAGDTVLTGDAPAWVEPASLDGLDARSGPAELIADFQHRIEDGVVQSYFDFATRIDNAQTLMNQNTFGADWLPDKGDITIHRLQILRGDETIDLLAGGAEFQVIRRETGLESRLLDGALTATLSIPGLRVGDVLRTSYSISLDDQALGDEAQVLQYLGSRPWRVGMGRAIVSWPEDEQMFWSAEAIANLADPVVRDGYRYLTVALPLAERPDMPPDAPSRYHRPTVLRVGSFADWNELSRVMAPHFAAASQVEAGGAVAREADAIMRQTSDPLERAALATRLVQDKVSYLLNGLDGGNYLPQEAEFTWDARYGDCKAKSVLLLSLLQRMGIEAEPVLVASRGGDALPELLPLPGDFDHMIVRARIAGVDYWLDGTSAGTRLANIGDVPPFYYALPVRAGGSDLVPMPAREKTVPDMLMTIDVDHSAGIDLPSMFNIAIDVFGPAGASLEQLADANDPAMIRRLSNQFINGNGFEGAVLTSFNVTYDKDNAIGRMVLAGIAPPDFTWQDGKFVAQLEGGQDIGFNPDRARSAWRAIPVGVGMSTYMKFETSMILPNRGKGFALNGERNLQGAFGLTRVASSSALEDERVVSTAEVWTTHGEIAPTDLAEARRQALRIEASNADLAVPSDVTWRWDLDPAERRRKIAPIIAGFDNAIALAADDDFQPLIGKARFLESIFEYGDALTHYDELVERSPSSWAHNRRAQVLLALGRTDDAIADLEASYDFDQDTGTAFELARVLAYAGQAEEALALLDGLPVREDERITYADTRATVTGLLGETEVALSLLEDEVADKPDNAHLLNAECWFRGLFNVAPESAIGGCTRAVERADSPVAALDSRAMVQFRLGNYDAAIADLNTVLRLQPTVAESRYLRGVARLKSGDKEGREDIETALLISPRLEQYYARHGVAPTT